MFELKDYNEDPDTTADVTGLGVISMMKASCNVQKSILMNLNINEEKNC